MKDLKISKELFEAVYNCDITTDKDMLGVYKRINIYEFAFKCKEWAYKNGYTIVDGIDELGESICYIMKITGYSLVNYYEQNINYKKCIYRL